LFEHGKVALQILTSDYDACPADILAWLKSRWREENFLKYASENYGIDKICDYVAEITVNTTITANPARKHANAQVRDAEKDLASAGRALAALLADPDTTPAAKNKAIPAANRAISTARKKLQAATAARAQVPAKLPAGQIDPDARTAVLHAGRRGLQMVLRLLAHNAEHWLATHLNAYLHDEDEYRAITRETIIRGLAGTITYATTAITVTPEPPAHRASPAPWTCSSAKSTTPRQSSPATTGRSHTASPHSEAFNPDRSRVSGDLGPHRLEYPPAGQPAGHRRGPRGQRAAAGPGHLRVLRPQAGHLLPRPGQDSPELLLPGSC
jgi:hypothetical protein